MLRSLFLILALATTASAEEVIRVDVQLVQVGFSVRDAEGALRSDLTADDFRVFEDGVEQEIRRFAPAERLPLRLGVLKDHSGSQDDFHKRHDEDLRLFLETMLQTEDRAFLLAFGDRLRLLAPFHNDLDYLGDVIRLSRKNVYFPKVGPDVRRRGGTALFDAVYHTVRAQYAEPEPARRAIVVLSDGSDNSSGYTLLDAIEAAQEHDVRIFGIWYGSDRPSVRDRYGQRVLLRLAEGTGGERFFAEGESLQEQFRMIGDYLRASYELGYYSSNDSEDDGFRRVEIRARKPGLEVRAKPGYFAEPGGGDNAEPTAPPSRAPDSP